MRKSARHSKKSMLISSFLIKSNFFWNKHKFDTYYYLKNSYILLK
jgi:hypothetical protein